MTFGATISRKKALAAATQAVDTANVLVDRHNETIEEVARVRQGLATAEGQLTKRLDAQRAMIEGCETTSLATAHELSRLEKLITEKHLAAIRAVDALGDYSNSQVVELASRQEAFEQMGFFARLRWLFTGQVWAWHGAGGDRRTGL